MTLENDTITNEPMINNDEEVDYQVSMVEVDSFDDGEEDADIDIQIVPNFVKTCSSNIKNTMSKLFSGSQNSQPLSSNDTTLEDSQGSQPKSCGSSSPCFFKELCSSKNIEVTRPDQLTFIRTTLLISVVYTIFCFIWVPIMRVRLGDVDFIIVHLCHFIFLRFLTKYRDCVSSRFYLTIPALLLDIAFMMFNLRGARYNFMYRAVFVVTFCSSLSAFILSRSIKPASGAKILARGVRVLTLILSFFVLFFWPRNWIWDYDYNTRTGWKIVIGIFSYLIFGLGGGNQLEILRVRLYENSKKIRLADCLLLGITLKFESIRRIIKSII